MRVIGGSSRGRKIEVPAVPGLRPTSDRVREAIFDILGSRGGLDDLDVLDLFAGSGALGIEALSRGARHVTFVELDRRAAGVIERNLGATGLEDCDWVVARRDALDYCRSSVRSFDVALIDPPYRFDDWACLLPVVRAELIVLESAAPPEIEEPFEAIRTYRYGGTLVTLAEARARRSERARVTTVLIPGSFDPFHNGHREIVERASGIFDEVVVAAMRNPQKSESLFSLEERKQMVAESLAHLGNVRIVSMSTLVVDVAREVGATVIVKGLRAVSDFESEMQMAQMNEQLSGIGTVFVMTGPSNSFLGSRLIREVVRYGGDVTALVPEPVARRLQASGKLGGASMSDSFVVDDDDESGLETTRRPPAADTEGLIDQLIDVITAAKSMPLSSSAIVSRDEVLELLERARELVPDEIHRARTMLREREDFHLKTRRDAEDILEEARVQAERMVQRTEIVRQSTHRARRIMEDAEAESRRRRREADDFVDQKLGNFEIVLDRTLRMVRAGRAKLAVDPFAEGGALDRGAEQAALDGSADDTDDFFDQDIT